jgi:universal stress protein A
MTIQKIACCVDFSDNAEAAFRTAMEMAKKYKAKLSVVHVLPPVVDPILIDTDWILPPEEPKKALILKVEQKVRETYCTRIEEGIESELVILDGHISSELINFLEKEKVDLVILGSYGTSGMGLVIFGSVAKRVSHGAHCSVMIVREKK